MMQPKTRPRKAATASERDLVLGSLTESALLPFISDAFNSQSADWCQSMVDAGFFDPHSPLLPINTPPGAARVFVGRALEQALSVTDGVCLDHEQRLHLPLEDGMKSVLETLIDAAIDQATLYILPLKTNDPLLGWAHLACALNEPQWLDRLLNANPQFAHGQMPIANFVHHLDFKPIANVTPAYVAIQCSSTACIEVLARHGIKATNAIGHEEANPWHIDTLQKNFGMWCSPEAALHAFQWLNRDLQEEDPSSCPDPNHPGPDIAPKDRRPLNRHEWNQRIQAMAIAALEKNPTYVPAMLEAGWFTMRPNESIVALMKINQEPSPLVLAHVLERWPAGQPVLDAFDPHHHQGASKAFTQKSNASLSSEDLSDVLSHTLAEHLSNRPEPDWIRFLCAPEASADRHFVVDHLAEKRMTRTVFCMVNQGLDLQSPHPNTQKTIWQRLEEGHSEVFAMLKASENVKRVNDLVAELTPSAPSASL